jgi:hypothetical protein
MSLADEIKLTIIERGEQPFREVWKPKRCAASHSS